MADVKPLKLVDQGAGVGRLVEFETGDTLPKSALPPLSAADVGAVAADDPRLSDAREWSAETVAQAEAEAGTAITRRAWSAQRVRQAIVAWWNSVSSEWGRGFVSSADAAAARTALGLGSAATRTALGTTGALYSRDSILGTVSQSGGVPTGAIIERGRNAAGEYVRYADGTLECTIQVLLSLNTLAFQNFNLPAAFANPLGIGVPLSATITFLTASAQGDNGSNGLWWDNCDGFTTMVGSTSQISVLYRRTTYAVTGYANITITGRWY